MRVPAALLFAGVALLAASCSGAQSHTLIIRQLAATPTSHFDCVASDHVPSSGGDCPPPNAAAISGPVPSGPNDRFVTIDVSHCTQISEIVIQNAGSDHPTVSVSCEPGEAP